jgi:hypothetical protein
VTALAPRTPRLDRAADLGVGYVIIDRKLEDKLSPSATDGRVFWNSMTDANPAATSSCYGPSGDTPLSELKVIQYCSGPRDPYHAAHQRTAPKVVSPPFCHKNRDHARAVACKHCARCLRLRNTSAAK